MTQTKNPKCLPLITQAEEFQIKKSIKEKMQALSERKLLKEPGKLFNDT
jgi:hypothetical protein